MSRNDPRNRRRIARAERIASEWPEGRRCDLATAIMREGLAEYAYIGAVRGTVGIQIRRDEGRHAYTPADVAARWLEWCRDAPARQARGRDVDRLAAAWQELRP